MTARGPGRRRLPLALAAVSAALALCVVFPCGAAAQLERAVLALPAAPVEMRAAALLMSGQEGGDLEIRAEAIHLPQNDDAVARGPEQDRDPERDRDRLLVGGFLVVVEVDGLGVLEGTRAGEPLEIFVYAVGPSLDVVDAASLGLPRPADHESQLFDAGVRALVPLRLAGGRGSQAGEPLEVRVLARAGDRFGLRKLSLAPRDDTPPTLDASGRWLVAWPAERPADDPELRLPFDPAAAQPRAFVPPAELSAGPSRGAAEGVAGAEPWPALLRRHGAEALAGTAPRRRPASPLHLPEELGRRLQAILDGYFHAVALRARGDLHGAADHLARLEARALAELGEGGLELLLGQEVRAYERLRRRTDSPRPLLALIRLHLDVAERHRREGRYSLSSFAMGTAVRITDWYAEEADRGRRRSDGDELRAEVASILTSLAGAAQTRGSLAEAVALYERALGHRDDDPVALFGLATVYSKVGEPDRAAELYERLVEADPRHHEARLRWAVMLQRSGSSRDLRRADRQLQELAAGEPAADAVPDWIASLAAQQRLRLALDDAARSGDFEAATEQLDAALARWGDHAPFRVAALRLATLRLATLRAAPEDGDRDADRDSDRDGDRDAVAERLASFDPGASPDLDPGGRTRFHEAPHPELEALRAHLAALEAERRPQLAAATAKILEARGLDVDLLEEGGLPDADLQDADLQDADLQDADLRDLTP